MINFHFSLTDVECLLPTPRKHTVSRGSSNGVNTPGSGRGSASGQKPGDGRTSRLSAVCKGALEREESKLHAAKLDVLMVTSETCQGSVYRDVKAVSDQQEALNAILKQAREEPDLKNGAKYISSAPPQTYFDAAS